MNPVPCLGGVAEQAPRLAQFIGCEPELGQTAHSVHWPEKAISLALCVDRAIGGLSAQGPL